MTNFLSDAQVRTLRAESQFVGDVLYQVDLCPFRGPDAPSCAIRRYHADRQMSKNRSTLEVPPGVGWSPTVPYAESSPRKTTGGLDLSKGRVPVNRSEPAST
jgi:hypothetical protein